MIRKLLDWAVANPLLVSLVVIGLVLGGGYAFTHVNIEAYPDPTPAIIDVVAQWPGAGAEQVERQVTIPLEVALAGMPGLQTTRSQSLFGLSFLRNQFVFGKNYWEARQEVLNRLSGLRLHPVGQLPHHQPPLEWPDSPAAAEVHLPQRAQLGERHGWEACEIDFVLRMTAAVHAFAFREGLTVFALKWPGETRRNRAPGPLALISRTIAA